jgi:hypothetical protein
MTAPAVRAGRAGEHGLQIERAHGFSISFDGNPASFVAKGNRAVLALSGSKVVAACDQPHGTSCPIIERLEGDLV